jgi:hypothetical protein
MNLLIIRGDMRETVAFITQMPDAGYSMLDIQECSNSAIQEHPVSGTSIQYQPETAMVCAPQT